MGITNEMSEEVKKQGRQFLGEDTPIITKDKCFKDKGANKQKKRNSGYNKCNVRASKNAEQAFSTLRYLYICYTQDFVFSSMIILKH